MRPSSTARTTTRLTLLVLLALAAAPVAHQPAQAAAYDSPKQIEADFLAGLRALQAGDSGSAIRIFRAILAERPELPRVRLELARAYFVAREWERSRREFFAVLSSGVPETVKANVLRFLRAIDARRGFDWNLSVAFSSSPQARRNFDTDKVLVDVLGTPLPFTIEREEDGDYGVSATGSAEYRVEIPGLSGEGVRVTAVGDGFFDVFEGEGGGADDYLVGAGLGLRGAWPQTTAFGSGFVSTRQFGGEHFEDRVGGRGGAEWRSVSGLSVFATGSAGVVDDHLSDLRDGTFLLARAGVAQSLGGRAIAGVALTAEHLDAEADFESFTTLGGEVFGTSDVGFGIDATARAYLLNQEFADRIPLLFEARDEWEYGLDVELTKTDIFLLDHFTPFVRAGYSRRTSSIDAFSYKELRFDIGVRKTF